MRVNSHLTHHRGNRFGAHHAYPRRELKDELLTHIRQTCEGCSWIKGGTDARLVKCTFNRTKIWSKLLGTSDTHTQHALVAASDGLIYVDRQTRFSLDGKPNNGQGNTFLTKRINDVVSPTVSVASNKTSLKISQTVTIVFVINESSTDTDLTLADLTVSGGPLSGFTGPGAKNTVTLTPTANSDVKTVVFAACNTFSDLAGNRNVHGIAIAQ